LILAQSGTLSVPASQNIGDAVMATVEHVDRTIGSAAATELLYRRHGSRVLRYCLRCLRRPADAEDALQQTFLQAHRALGRGVEPVAEATWLLTIARNVCLTRVDAHRRRARVEFAEDPSVLAESAGADDAPPELSAEIVEALARLPERQRQVLFLRAWQELSYAEIAAALGTTESAVETLLFRGRNALAAQLGAPRRRRRGLDLAGLLGGWGRSLSGVAIPKVVAGGVAVVAVAAAGVATTNTHRHVRQVVPVAARASAPVSVLVPAVSRVRSHRHDAKSVSIGRRASPVSTVAPPQTGVESPPPGEPVGAPGPGSGSAAATPPAGAVPAAPTVSVVAAPALAPVVAPVTADLDATVQTAVAAVPAAAAPVDQAAQDVAATATNAASAPVSSAVSQLLPGH
jgi:RNA polymerase sigma-70 factor (ECF subfamily)